MRSLATIAAVCCYASTSHELWNYFGGNGILFLVSIAIYSILINMIVPVAIGLIGSLLSKSYWDKIGNLAFLQICCGLSHILVNVTIF